MASPGQFYVRCSRLVSITLATACFLLYLQTVQGATVAEIRGAWEQHSAGFKAISYKFHQVRTEELGANDPFGELNPDDVKKKVSLKGTVTLLRAGEKASVTRTVELWDIEQGKPLELSQQFSFDGARHMIFPGGKTGRIEHSDTLVGSINNNPEFIPLWWAHWPQERLIHHGGATFEDMVVSGEPLDCSGTPCIELTVNSPKSPDTVQRIYVDPAHGYRVVRVNQFYQDVFRRELMLVYENDDAFGRKVASFKSNSFDPEGEPNFALESEVDACEIDPQLTERSFQVDFPVGIRIAEEGKYFEQEPNGKLREIKEEDYIQALTKQGEL